MNELSRLVAEIDDEVSAEQSIEGLREHRAPRSQRPAAKHETIEGYRSIARMVAKDRIGPGEHLRQHWAFVEWLAPESGRDQ